jgi:hypothetical protein
MPMCLPTPRIAWARDSAGFTYWGPRWLGTSYWRGRAAAEATTTAAHPATVAGVVAQVTAASPAGCNAQVSQSGPFDNVSHTGWWSGSGTVTRSTEAKGIYVCDEIPEGAIEYT